MSQPGVCESQLWACVDFHSRMNGAQYLAYPPVVAGGSRANTIHYTSNNQIVGDGEMILMDAGITTILIDKTLSILHRRFFLSIKVASITDTPVI